ncbi:MAG: cation:proton antiporter [Candidatus Binatia bacterium]
MTEGNILRDLVVLFAAALPIVYIFQRLNVPSVVGFLIAGIVIGPNGAGLIAQTADVESLAELGLVLLLFVVGLELSLAQLARLGRIIVWSGCIQVFGTGALGYAVAWLLGLSLSTSLLLGFLLAHSSTAIVLKTLSDRGEINAPHGRLTVGILLIQDLSLIPMMLLVRLLATGEAMSWLAVGTVLLQAAGTVTLIIVAARLLMPAVLRQIVTLRSRELFTGVVILLCLGTAWLAAWGGLSLALGALIAGLVISESEYSHQAIAEILPFRDAFNSVFFISVGMLLRLDFLWAHLPLLIGSAVALMVCKTAVTALAVASFYRSVRVAMTTALSLAQIGELAFVLAQFALPAGLMTAQQYEVFVAVAVLSMIAAPFLIFAASRVSYAPRGLLAGTEVEADAAQLPVRNHVLIVGYGLNGEHLAHVLQETGLPYLILEINPDRLAVARRNGEPSLYGDATRGEVLRQAGAAAAHVVVVAISDPVATRRIVALTRQLSPRVPIIVRTRYVAEMDDLQRLGATEVIPEEFETSVEIFARVLRRLRVPRNVITLQVELIRNQGYSMLRGLALPRQTLDQLDQILAATTTESFMVPKGSPAAGRTIRDLQLRKMTGATVIAVVRGGQPSTNPSPDFAMQPGDILVMVGSHGQLDQALTRLGAAAELPALRP